MLSIRPNLFSYDRMANYRFVTGDADGAIAICSKPLAKKAEAQRELERIDAVAKLEAAANQKANRTLGLIHAIRTAIWTAPLNWPKPIRGSQA